MKSLSKIFGLILALTLLVTCLAGCGGGGETPPPADDGGAVAGGEEAGGAPDKTYIIYSDNAFAPFEYLDESTGKYVGVDMDIFRAFTEGFLEMTAQTLTPNEVDTLALSSFVLACELAGRFLDDYILGDPYFKINYPEHNLVRTRCQIALAKDMQNRMEEMNQIVRECVAAHR